MLKYASQSIVTCPQGSVRRVPSICGVLVSHRVIALQTTSYLPLALCLLMFPGISLCVSLARFGRSVPQVTSKQPAVDF